MAVGRQIEFYKVIYVHIYSYAVTLVFFLLIGLLKFSRKYLKINSACSVNWLNKHLYYS
jgi:hypothetical protein